MLRGATLSGKKITTLHLNYRINLENEIVVLTVIVGQVAEMRHQLPPVAAGVG